MFRLRSRPGRRPRGIPAAIVYVISAVVVIGGIIAWDILTRPAPVDPRDPAVRAKAAAQSITGQPTVRRVEMVQDRVIVHATSRYYDPEASQEGNREYLATEGRLIVQLILYDVPEVPVARVELYSGRRHLVSIEGVTGQRYEDYRVIFSDLLAP